MQIGKGVVFWCPKCKITFSSVDKNGVAVCPICNYQRNDGLNLLDDNRFQCTQCRAKFPNLSKIKRPACINGCKYNGG